MTELVLDATIIVKWFVVEPHSQAARRILQLPVDFLAPDFMPAEVMSAMLKKYRQGAIERADVFLARDSLKGVFELVPSEPLLDEAVALAVSYQRSAYDSLYVVVASARGCQMVTADRRLYEALAPHFPGTMLWIEDVAA